MDSMMNEELRAAFALLTTKEDLHTAVHEEGERLRQYMKVLFDAHRADIQRIAEHVQAIMARLPDRTP